MNTRMDQEQKKGSEEWGSVDRMIYLPQPPGERHSFRCDCLCNVFRQSTSNPYRFKCNACNAVFVGEP